MEKCCSECPEPRVAQSLCTFCNKWLCFQCTDLHQHERTSAGAPPETRLQPDTSSPTAPPEPGSSCCSRTVIMCPLHKQELLELFCETCDLLTCSICHLSAHKDHRLMHVSKALQDQHWLLENLMARVEEKRSAVESTAKQIQGRFHSVKITQKKAENQIKMAKMIMMNELNKRANLLIEQLESISSGFKQHLEDQLQGAIELCSQLEHLQNFITWAVAHHRRNPLLFSKELIALQMQQLLEPLIHSESWTPLKIKFNWDASFWTKQISNLGHLTVDGGSRSYAEGRAGILRPQPVPCVSVPSLCFPLRETDCRYPSFCQHQLCCLHCRPAPSVPLEKFTHPLDKYPVPHAQEPSCSSPTSLQRCWSSDTTTTQMHPSKNSTQMESVQQRVEPIKHTSDPRNQEIFPETEHDEDLVGVEVGEDHLSAQADEDMRASGSSEMLVEDRTDPETPESSTEPCGVSADPGLSDGISYRSGSYRFDQNRAPEEQEHTHTPDSTSPTERIQEDLMIRINPGRRDGSSQTIYKTEPDNVYAYSYEKSSCTSSNKYSMSRKIQPTRRKAPEASKVPVVCLERLKILVSRCPPQGHHNTVSPADSREKCEGNTSQELDREHSAEGEPGEELGQRVELDQIPSELPGHHSGRSSPVGSESAVQELSNQRRDPLAPSTALAQYSHPGSRTPESEPNPSEPRSVPASGLHLESTAAAEFLSDAELESELQVGSDLSSMSDPQIQSDSESDLESEQVLELSRDSEQELELSRDSEQVPDLSRDSEQDLELSRESEQVLELSRESEKVLELSRESEHVPEISRESEQFLELSRESEKVLELSRESEQELESDPDSTTEVILNLDQECEEECVQEGDEEEVVTIEQGCVEMENEDFCAVCSIGGELLCCDRCPKVFHLNCHVPSLLSFPTGDWVCSLCRDVQQPEVEYDCEDSRLPLHITPFALSPSDLRKCEKLTLLIYSNLLSAPFHEPVSPLARHYYQIIKRPMDLSVIRSRLKRNSSSHYSSAHQFISDILLMFKNCAKFNYPDSEVAQAGRSLQSFFLSQLGEVFPDLGCPAPDEDSDSTAHDDDDDDDDEEDECVAAVTFPWPERREQSHRKRKRRRSLSWRRYHY